MSAPVITIDGPSGVGKGTVSAYLAKALGWHYLDSGALYRILGYAADQGKIDFEDESALLDIIEQADIRFSEGAHLNGSNVEGFIRNETAGDHASRVAKHPKVRHAMLGLQHDFQQAPGLVADGRDMGTTIFPESAYKFYLIADAEERAKRRCKQLKEKGLDGNIGALFRDIQQRDERDMNRSDSPLCPAKDAIIIDTSLLSIDEVLEEVMKHLPYKVSI
ncbi:MAG: (d)CMP kinase [Arenicellales bacterium]